MGCPQHGHRGLRAFRLLMPTVGLAALAQTPIWAELLGMCGGVSGPSRKQPGGLNFLESICLKVTVMGEFRIEHLPEGIVHSAGHPTSGGGALVVVMKGGVAGSWYCTGSGGGRSHPSPVIWVLAQSWLIWVVGCSSGGR